MDKYATKLEKSSCTYAHLLGSSETSHKFHTHDFLHIQKNDLHIKKMVYQ